MSVTVFLSNTNIQIVVGSGAAKGIGVKRLVSVGVPGGAVLNGVVMDENALIEAIRECWKINKLPKGDVTLILNSPQLRANIIDMPLMQDKKATDYIQREAKDTRLAKPVTAWYLIDKDAKQKTQRVIAETADSQFIDTYVGIFAKAGLRLADIHDGVSLAISLLRGSTRNKTIVYMILDGTSLVTIFFAKGQYYYHSTKRVFNQPGSPEFAREIFGSISEIRQFASAQKLEDMIEEIQFAGLGEQQVIRLSEDIGDIDNNIKLSAVLCPSYVKVKENSKQFPYFVYPISGLTRLSASRLDIMTANKKSADKFIKKQNALKIILPAGGFLLLLVMIYAALTGFTIYQKQQLRELNAANSDPVLLENVNRYKEISDVITGVGGRQGGLNILHGYLDSYPIPDSEVNKLIIAAAEKHGVTVIVNSYSADSGIFSITAQSAEVEKINQFIADLMKMDTFEKIDYTGYNAMKDKDGNSGWQINVVCTLAARKSDTKNSGEDA
jgi:hypothetical protein